MTNIRLNAKNNGNLLIWINSKDRLKETEKYEPLERILKELAGFDLQIFINGIN